MVCLQLSLQAVNNENMATREKHGTKNAYAASMAVINTALSFYLAL